MAGVTSAEWYSLSCLRGNKVDGVYHQKCLVSEAFINESVWYRMLVLSSKVFEIEGL